MTVLLPMVPDRYRAIVATAGGAGLRWGEAAGLCADAIDLDQRRLRVIRTIIEVSGQTSFKPFPKSAAGRRSVPLPPWLVEIIQEHRESYPSGQNGLVFPNAVGKPLRRTLFRSRVWRPALVRTGMLGTVSVIDDYTTRACWVDPTGTELIKEFPTEREAVLHIARSCVGGPRFHDLRHSYAMWLDDGVPPNMVARVMGHEKIITTLQLYTRRTDDESRILDALTDKPEEEDGPDDDDDPIGAATSNR